MQGVAGDRGGEIDQGDEPIVIQRIWHRPYKQGDWVVFRKVKRSTSPGPRARRIAPTRYGEEYIYEVKKFYVVVDVEDGYVVVCTRKGRRYRIPTSHPRLRRAHWWERWWYRRRFPSATGSREIQQGKPTGGQPSLGTR